MARMRSSRLAGAHDRLCPQSSAGKRSHRLRQQLGIGHGDVERAVAAGGAAAAAGDPSAGRLAAALEPLSQLGEK